MFLNFLMELVLPSFGENPLWRPGDGREWASAWQEGAK